VTNRALFSKASFRLDEGVCQGGIWAKGCNVRFESCMDIRNGDPKPYIRTQLM
jgi:hypothetical protein